ncbi:MAG: Ig domain-containing protein, partial [Acidobacteriota bacterium]
LAGTPAAIGTSTVTIRATDNNGCFAEIVYTIVVGACPVITLSPATVPNGAVSVAYSQAITASGGTGPYTFTLPAGTLPPGLTLSAAGVVSGMPLATGTNTFTVRGTDANGCFAEATYTMAIVAAVPTLPQTFVMLLALGLMGIGYMQLRRRGRSEARARR